MQVTESFVFFSSIRRSGGQTGNSTVSWRITSSTTLGSDARETFESIEGTLEFADGEKSKELHLQVRCFCLKMELSLFWN